MVSDEPSYNLLKIRSNILNQNTILDSRPVQIHFLMVDKCNAKCIMCGGNYFQSKSGRMITVNKFEQMASNLQLEFCQGIVLAGAGDPLLNPHLIPIIQYANERYPLLAVALTTNGIALSEEISQALLQCRLKMINVSINAACRKVYKKIMQVDCFDRVCENVKKFMSLRKLKGCGPPVQFSSAINRLNIEDLPVLVEMSKQIGIEGINVMYCRFYPERIRHLNVGREEDRLLNQDSLFFHQELSDQMVERAKSLAKQYGMHFCHEPLFKEYADAQPCHWPESELMVGFDGEVYPCGGGELHFKEKVEKGIYHFGNALNEPIEKFWNGDLYRALRRSSKNKDQGPVVECRTCANRMKPNELQSHIMHWEGPEEPKEIPGGEKGSLKPREGRMTKSPLVSVIVPTYNRPEKLVEALKSILEQSYQNLEIIVINDRGADVENIIFYLNQRLNITYINHGRNRGLAAARNTGIRVARGKYLAYLDDDDLFYPDHLETLVSFLEGGDYRVAYTDAYRAYQKKENGKYIVTRRDLPYSFDFDSDRILVGNYFPVLCLMHEKACLDRVGLFDEELTTQEDWDLWIRLSRKYEFAHIPRVTCEFSWREDGTTMTSIQGRNFLKNRKRIYEKYREYSKNKAQILKAQETFLENYEGMVTGEYAQGQKLIEEGRIDEAIAALEGLLKLSPMHSPAYDDLGALYYQKGDHSRALEYFVKALEADASNTNAMKNLADLSLELGGHEEALQFYRKILAHQPGDVDALLGVGDYCLLKGQIRDARRFYEKVVSIDPENGNAKSKLDGLREKRGGSAFPAGADRILAIDEPAPKISSIIIPVHNQLEYTKKCLESIFTHTHPPFELIVVDNGSTDGTAEYLEKVKEGRIGIGGFRLKVESDGKVSAREKGLPGGYAEDGQTSKEENPRLSCTYFRVISNRENLGYAQGNNLGMAIAQGDYILLLNNDLVVTPGWLDRLIAAAERDGEIGIVGPMSNYVSGSQWVKEIDYNPNSLEGLDRFAQSFAKEHEGQGERVLRCVGFCMLIRRAVVEKIGGFDRLYGLGNFEDDDFCLRAALAGFQAWMAKDCFVHHFGNRTFMGARIDFGGSLRQNWELFKKKWGIPSSVAYGESYNLSHLSKEGFIPKKHYFPLSPTEELSKKGEELFAAGDLDGARGTFEEILVASPDEREALNNLGVVAFHQNHLELATDYFNRALQVDPSYLDAMVNLGNCLMKKKEFSQATQWFKKALDRNPHDVGLLNDLGNCFIQLEDFAEAEKMYERSFRLDGNQSHVGEILETLERIRALGAYREAAF